MSYAYKQRYLTGIGENDDVNYDAVRNAKEKYYSHPEKYGYTSERSNHSNDSSRYHRRHEGPHRVNVVVEHWSGCTGERATEDIRDALEDYFPDVKFKEFYGRVGSFEVFINGRLLYSRLMQGGYPSNDEVLHAVWRARRGKEVHEVDRFSRSRTCTLL